MYNISTSICEQEILGPLQCRIVAGGRIEGGAERRPEILVIYIYTKVSGSGEGLRAGFRSFELPRLSAPGAQNRPERAQSRSEPLRIAWSVLRIAWSVLRIAQSGR